MSDLRSGREQLRVLLAEDNPTNQMVISRMLRHHGHLVSTRCTPRPTHCKAYGVGTMSRVQAWNPENP